ncbi:MAG: DUF6340 family protein [Bacteroidota bacterium]|nr:DUF6340 family protein [Bacteroidota bacterium]
MKFLSTSVILCGLLLSSCQTVSVLTIEVKRPAEIVIPENVSKVVVVNNALNQPDDFGHSASVFDGGTIKKSNPAINTAGLAEEFTSELAKRLNSLKWFKVYQQRLARSGSKTFLEDLPLSRNQIREINDSISPDLIISLDRMLFESDINLRYQPNQYVYKITMDGRAYPSVRVIDPKGLKVLYTLRQQDSLFWQDYGSGDNVQEALRYFPAPQSCFDDLAMYSVDKMMKKLVPYSDKVDRIYYISGNINMHDAANYVKANRWDEAASIWQYIYEHSKRKKLKAFTASNLALYMEISDKYDEAIEWAEKSRSHFLEMKSEAAQSEAENLNSYIRELQRRKSDSQKLDIQLR